MTPEEAKGKLATCASDVARAESDVAAAEGKRAERVKEHELCTSAAAAAADGYETEPTAQNKKRLVDAGDAVNAAALLVSRATARRDEAHAALDGANKTHAAAQLDVQKAELSQHVALDNLHAALAEPAARWMAAFDALRSAGDDLDNAFARANGAATKLTKMGVYTLPPEVSLKILPVLVELTRRGVAFTQGHHFQEIREVLTRHPLGREPGILVTLLCAAMGRAHPPEYLRAANVWLQAVHDHWRLQDAMAAIDDQGRRRGAPAVARTEPAT